MVMHEMNMLVTFFVLSGVYIALYYVAENIFMKDVEPVWERTKND